MEKVLAIFRPRNFSIAESVGMLMGANTVLLIGPLVASAIVNGSPIAKPELIVISAWLVASINAAFILSFFPLLLLDRAGKAKWVDNYSTFVSMACVMLAVVGIMESAYFAYASSSLLGILTAILPFWRKEEQNIKSGIGMAIIMATVILAVGVLLMISRDAGCC